jgi:hypothetical protein
MPLTLKKIELLSSKKLQLLLSFFAAFIAITILYNRHGVIDPDSVLYFEAARLFSLGQWHEGYNVFNWPFYSLCIAAMHKISSLNIHQSATLLNVIFFTITSFSFLKIIELCGGKKLEIVIGALILFSSNQIVGNILGILMRDEGFWAFLLTALVFFIRFYKSRSYLDAFYWQISIIIATLFRVEGIGFLILLPLSLFTFNKSETLQNIRTYLKANFLNISLLVFICGVALISPHISMQDFGRLDEIFNINAYQQFTSKLFIKAKIMSSQVLGSYLDEYAVQGILLTFSLAIPSELIHITGRLTSLLGFLGVYAKDKLIDQQIRKILYVSAGIATLNVAIITIKAFVLTQRYVLALSFVLMIFSTFYLAYLCKYIFTKRNIIQKVCAVFIIVYLSISLIKNLLPQNKDLFIQQEAVAWLKLNNTLNKPVFYDESRVRYYASEPFMGKFNRYQKVITNYVNDKSILNYEFLLINFSNDDLSYEDYIKNATPEFIEVKRFCSGGNKVCAVIFKKK